MTQAIKSLSNFVYKNVVNPILKAPKIAYSCVSEALQRIAACRSKIPSCDFESTIPNLYKLIEDSNQNKRPDAPVLLILQSKDDWNHAFSNCHELIELTKKYRIIFRIVDSPESFFSTINDESEKMRASGKEIGTVLVRAHGSPNSIYLNVGRKGLLMSKHFTPGCLDKLPPNCKLVFSCCSLAEETPTKEKNIATVITEAAGSRTVRAYRRPGISGIEDCHEHGIVLAPSTENSNSKIEYLECFHPELIFFTANAEPCSVRCQTRITQFWKNKLIEKLDSTFKDRADLSPSSFKKENPPRILFGAHSSDKNFGTN